MSFSFVNNLLLALIYHVPHVTLSTTIYASSQHQLYPIGLKSWTHINGPPTLHAILSSPNFTFICPSCLLNTSSNKSTKVSSPSVISILYVSIIFPFDQLYLPNCIFPNIWSLQFPPSFITANIPSHFPYYKSYASTIISFSSPTPIQSPLVPHIPLILPHHILLLYLVNFN